MQQLNVILQGGGTRCAYQMSFLNKLLSDTNFTNRFTINDIYGTSFGALVGYFACIKRLDILHNFFMSLNENSLKPHFNLWGYIDYIKNIPFIGKVISVIVDIIWIIKSITYKSLYDQNIGIKQLFDIKLDDIQKENLKHYYCCVYNITKQKTEYINGTHPLLNDYILASSSLWIVFKPKLIPQLKSECICDQNCCCYLTKFTNPNDICDCNVDTHKFNEFMDGGILKPIPYEYDKSFNGKYLILTTKDIDRINNRDFLFNNTGEHLFEYLDNIITFLVEYHQHLDMQYVNRDWHKNHNIYLINYKPKSNNPTILNKQIIQEYINDGNVLSNNFLNNTILRIPTN
ncbi:patatin-like phospholipase [Fadolivirus algeromassiliense]|jgi:predicted acylesterase/phospholipase RssA|uniref:Patatin-like phospholipase n=1 Tax=Fadolivirus FV1/VV64 TaxID=3070911 RepID=A0A7D3QVV5_9VIRU|nr:patatin-like phospholipase [Fadolivirus algeromassiliense]QKF94046.1 patatin-like phospholipase [Fadolivirus FV1/VV64]